MKHPTREECERLLEEYGTPEHVKGHCRAVAATGYAIGQALNEKGFHLDLELILASGLLHDIARVEDKHWEVGAELAEKLGYRAESEIIKVHMTYSPFSKLENITETDLVCLGDRLVKEDEYVGLDSRINYVINKARRNGHPEAKPYILKKKRDARRFMDEIEAVIGTTIDRLMRDTDTDHLTDIYHTEEKIKAHDETR
ncbi:MAG: HD domain-containing protein [Bacillota bacterium]|nr:HD domain-containing protein [Bacillota bacterium]